MFVQLGFISCFCQKHARLLVFLFLLCFLCFLLWFSRFRVSSVYAYACSLHAYAYSKYAYACPMYVHAYSCLGTLNSFLAAYFLFFIYMLSLYLTQPSCLYISVYFVLFHFVLFYLFYAYQGFNLFKYHEHALMHRCCDAMR